jgi:uncharacterized protein YoxC
MTGFEILLLTALGFLVLAVIYVGAEIRDLRRSVDEVWKRMKRLD